MCVVNEEFLEFKVWNGRRLWSEQSCTTWKRYVTTAAAVVVVVRSSSGPSNSRSGVVVNTIRCLTQVVLSDVHNNDNDDDDVWLTWCTVITSVSIYTVTQYNVHCCVTIDTSHIISSVDISQFSRDVIYLTSASSSSSSNSNSSSGTSAEPLLFHRPLSLSLSQWRH